MQLQKVSKSAEATLLSRCLIRSNGYLPILLEFKDSGEKAMELVGWDKETTNIYHKSTAIQKAIKRYKLDDIICTVKMGHIFLVRKDSLREDN